MTIEHLPASEPIPEWVAALVQAERAAALAAAADAIQAEADAHEVQFGKTNTATGPMYAAAQIVRGLT